MERALDAVAEFVRSIPSCQGDMVQKFVLLVETIDEDDRWISTFTAPGQKRWDTLGMLEYGMTLERNQWLDPNEGDE